jgi:ectoine hydroxylase
VTGLTYRSRTVDEPDPVPRHEKVVWGGTGPLDHSQLAEYDERGFVELATVLETAELDQIGAEVRRLSADVALRDDERAIIEPSTDDLRSVFEVHRLSESIARLAASERLAGVARQLLGSDVYLHQTRLNLKPGFRGEPFYWHSDFETWHFEDGMPEMRAVSASISLTDNLDTNGSLMIIPGSHRTFIGCAGETPTDHYRESLRAQQFGVPSDHALARLVANHGIHTVTGPAGSAVFFDCNAMHGSNSNITPFARRNLFFVYNSVENALRPPYGGTAPRPTYIAAREGQVLTAT